VKAYPDKLEKAIAVTIPYSSALPCRRTSRIPRGCDGRDGRNPQVRDQLALAQPNGVSIPKT